MSSHTSDQMSQRSQRSLGSLCSVVKTLIVSGVRQSYRPSKGQGHLLGCSGQLKTSFENKYEV